MIGIRREDKNRWERRVPLTPTHVAALGGEHAVGIRVQPSPLRCFPDRAYREAGAGVVEEAIRTSLIASTHGPVRVPAPAFAELPLGRKAIGVPIVIQGRVVAVLYADQGAQAQSPDHPAEGSAWPAALEVMTRHASRSLEANGALHQAQPAAADAETANVGGVR